MRQDRDILAREMAEKLRAGERAVEHALRVWSEIIGMVPRATAQSHVSLEMGQKIAASAGAAVSALVAVRGHAISTHTAMAEVRDHLGLDTSAYGPDSEKPPTENPMMIVRREAA